MREQNKGLICSRHEERLACKLAEELPTVWHPAPADSAGEQLINRLRLSSSQSSFTLQSWSVHLEPALLRPGSSPPSFPLPSLCEIGPLNHTVPFHPAPRRHRGVTSARDEFCHKSWLYFMLQCILFTRAKPSSLGTLHQATFPHPNGVSNRNKQIQSQSCFLCKSPWNASKYFFFPLTIWPAQGDRLGELKMFGRTFPFTKHWKKYVKVWASEWGIRLRYQWGRFILFFF